MSPCGGDARIPLFETPYKQVHGVGHFFVISPRIIDTMERGVMYEYTFYIQAQE
jgi:hypothetical protein